MADLDFKNLDAVERRRLQNRLNQQASRKRKALERISKGQTRRWVVYTDEARSPPPSKCQESRLVANHHPRREDPTKDVDKVNGSLCTATQTGRVQYWEQLQIKVTNGAVNNLQSPNLLLSVTQFNTMRAMVANADTMGLSLQVLCEDIASHFNISGPHQTTLQLPPSLQPSSSQKQIIHHPWIDIIPIESLRNSLLTKMGIYDEDELCVDFYGMCGSCPEVGLLVWGEAWDPSAYELSEGFFQKWNWLLRDCTDLIKSTNYWRKQRGQGPLRIESESPRIKEIEE